MAVFARQQKNFGKRRKYKYMYIDIHTYKLKHAKT